MSQLNRLNTVQLPEMLVHCHLKSRMRHRRTCSNPQLFPGVPVTSRFKALTVTCTVPVLNPALDVGYRSSPLFLFIYLLSHLYFQFSNRGLRKLLFQSTMTHCGGSLVKRILFHLQYIFIRIEREASEKYRVKQYQKITCQIIIYQNGK